MRNSVDWLNRMLVRYLLLAALPLAAADPDLVNSRWPAYWIAHSGVPARAYSVLHFRKAVEFPEKPQKFVVRVSADNRYRLYVNGRFAAAGPVQSDLRHWRYDRLDLAPFLQRGRNVFAAVVWNGGEFKPMAQVSDRTGFLIQGEAADGQQLNTNSSWRVLADAAYQPIEWAQVDKRLMYQYYVAGATERFSAALHPWGWEQPDFDDGNWTPAQQLSVAVPRNVEGHVRWQLAATDVPQMEVRRRPPPRPRSDNATFPVLVPANARRTLLLDEGELTTGYPELTWSGGKGAVVRVTYAEALYDQNRVKGKRDDIAGKRIIGVYDEILPDDQARQWCPLWTRSWRFAELEIQTAGEPLKLTGWTAYETGFPARLRARFECDREDLNRIWRTGQRTLQLAAQDVLVSDLYWERIQYIGDARLQSLAWMSATGDDVLFRQALQQFDSSRSPEGLTQSRYPADLEQYTPLYSLVWINMLHDWWTYRGEPDFVRQFVPGMEQVLSWYDRHANADGLIQRLPGLDFVDSDYNRQYDAILSRDGRTPLAVHSLLYLYALLDAAELAKGLGLTEHERAWRLRAADLRTKITSTFWDARRKMMSDTPTQRFWSQHANVLAVLTGIVTGTDAEDLIRRTLADPSLAPLQLYFRFYLGRALNKAGLSDLYPDQLGPWSKMIANGMTTFGERDGEPRSECHPWSATPVFELLSSVAGIQPAEPGFRNVRIAPALANLQFIRAAYPHPLGDVSVDIRKEGGRVSGTILLPAGLEGVFVWAGRETRLHAGANQIAMPPMP